MRNHFFRCFIEYTVPVAHLERALTMVPVLTNSGLGPDPGEQLYLTQFSPGNSSANNSAWCRGSHLYHTSGRSGQLILRLFRGVASIQTQLVFPPLTTPGYYLSVLIRAYSSLMLPVFLCPCVLQEKSCSCLIDPQYIVF